MNAASSAEPYDSPLSWTTRLALGAIAIVGTIIYAASFALTSYRDSLLPIAIAIGIASAVSWPGFGVSLLMVTRCRPSVMAWADACLIAQCTGIAVLMISGALNLILYFVRPQPSSPIDGIAYLHGTIVMAADVVMAIGFVRRAKQRGMTGRVALALWVLALNGLFVAALLGLLWSLANAR